MAMLMAMEGVATLACTVTAGGILENCNAIEETPREFGFAAAALSLAPYFRLRPEVRDGRAAATEVRIPIRFMLPEPVSLITPHRPTSPRALTLARELVRADGRSAMIREVYATKAQLIEVIRTPGAPLEARRTAAAATRGAADARMEEILDHMAAMYAAVFSERELADLVRAVRSSTPPPYLIARPEVARVGNKLSLEFSRRLQIASRAAFCEARACVPDRDFGLPRADHPSPKVTIAAPIWLERPTAAQVETARPPLATAFGLEGRVQLACTVAQLGIVDTCDVVEESPNGVGFGAAAQTLRGYFRLSSAMLQRDAGDVVVAEIRFPRPAVKGGDLDGDASASDATLALAKAYVEKVVGTDVRDEQVGFAMRTLEALKLEGVDPADRAVALKVLRTASDRVWLEMTDVAARAYTGILSEAQMRAGLAFLETPTGKAMKARQRTMTEVLQATVMGYDSVIAADAGRAFCKVRGCTGPKTQWLRPPPQSARKS